jgi:energy-coupling factor transporter ATP-binding protein EcfA2
VGSPQLEAATSALHGAVAGLFLAALAAWLLGRRNLRASFALVFLVVPGWLCLRVAGEPYLGGLLVSAGLLGAGFRRLRIATALKAGGEIAEHARQARTIREVARNRRDRRRLRRFGPMDWPGTYVLGEDENGTLARLPLGREEGRHVLLIGATGAGKTTTLSSVLWRHVEGGSGAILIDPKGDPALVERARHEALARSRAFYCFSLDSPRDHWNPLAAGTPSEKADKLIGAEEWTEPHYKRLYQRYLLNLFLAIEAHGETAHLGLVVELLNPDRLAMYCRAIDGAVAAERLAGYLEDLTTEERRQLSGLRNRLALLTESEHGAQLQPPAQPENAVDLALAVAQQAVVVFSLNSARYPETVKLLGAAIFQDLKTVAGRIEADAGFGHPAVVAVDEFAAFGADHVLGLFQRARSARLSLLLATQELADLRRIDEAFQDQVLGNVETVVAHRQNVPDSAELVAQIAGTREAWIHTFQTDDRMLLTGTAQFGLGTRHRGHEFLVAPDTIKRLRTGDAIVIRKTPHDARRVSVYVPEWPEAFWTPESRAALEADHREVAYGRTRLADREQAAMAAHGERQAA